MKVTLSSKALQRSVIALLSFLILAGSAWAAIQVLIPWAPRETYLIATDNTIARLSASVLQLKSLLRTSKELQEKRWLKLEIQRLRRKIDAFKDQQKQFVK